ncbi:hypothetical protein KM1_254940 [Entamoeba histolytica HM-3:IMSS]|uniref:WD repeat-containing protein 75 second beta-propeller domain-containing protein n=7 Tax=Entamoeba histolytica TaxID=5759 RepID=C4LWN4_ENTH1|nr:hypothetical protein, conserved [Entamoeba histolytica HM-1:IMSS]EMD49412.1 Hypothetical protein EHI5A_173000 [Entamoeba histolytica KU27]EMS13018.1 hypothetical protein KM1_254940 [Entamoeba histolytica HM-3:IMSS]ENY65697.1 hypothetical protein EHI7A_165340 [Entamoeba histolytica HM-1:IMSS-A]GAT93123.1 hypothetical protein conserved [Entamoeba histolytica]EAL45817.2 hypothetical protein, conserved [Entamoeba histolytica HM-1:IMSS]|eukprot:XP_651201.2 hypothetical protein, conserved [Entamoeba histolytica HM-1:IMSS]
MEPTVGGGIITDHVLFINESEEIVASGPKGLNFYKISNGQIISRLIIKEKVVGIFTFTSDSIFVITVDGTISLYSTDTYTLTKQWKTIIEDVQSVQKLDNMVFYMKSRTHAFLITINVNSDFVKIKETVNGTPSSDGKIIYAFNGNNIFLIDRIENKKYHTKVQGHIRNIYVHPKINTNLFVCCEGGVFYLLHCDEELKKGNQLNKSIDEEFHEFIPTINKFHWHFKNFDGFALFQNGERILTGGDNGVLVFWKTIDGSQSYLPEIGAEIKKITVNNISTLAALSLANNSIVIVSLSQKKIVRIIAGLIKSDKIIIHPGPKGQVITTGNGPILQFYDPSGDRCVASAEVSRPNVLLESLEKRKLPDADVKYTSMIGDDEWMVTYDLRNMSSRYHESNLRFFRKKQNGTYEQMVCIPEPFQSEVTSITSSPSHKVVITTSLDHVFKVWVLVTRQTIKTKGGVRSNVTWKCRSIGAYYGEPSYSASISKDGSVMAVSFKTAITIWDVLSNKLLFSLPVPYEQHGKEFIPVEVQFLSNSQYILTKSKQGVIIYDLLSRKIYQSFLCTPILIAAHRTLNLYSFVNKNTGHWDVFLMKIGEIKPVAVWRIDTEITSMVFYTTVTGLEYICAVTKNSEIYSLPLENMIGKDIPQPYTDTKVPEKKAAITLKKIEMDESNNETRVVKIVSESTLDGLEANISDVNNIFNVIVDCLLK